MAANEKFKQPIYNKNEDIQNIHHLYSSVATIINFIPNHNRRMIANKPCIQQNAKKNPSQHENQLHYKLSATIQNMRTTTMTTTLSPVDTTNNTISKKSATMTTSLTRTYCRSDCLRCSSRRRFQCLARAAGIDGENLLVIKMQRALGSA